MNGQTIHGVIHGNTIELASSPNLADGMEVEVIIREIKHTGTAKFSVYPWTEHDDAIFQQIELERKQAVMRDVD